MKKGKKDKKKVHSLNCYNISSVKAKLCILKFTLPRKGGNFLRFLSDHLENPECKMGFDT